MCYMLECPLRLDQKPLVKQNRPLIELASELRVFSVIPPPALLTKILSPPPSWCLAEQYGSSFCVMKFVYFN